MDKLRCEIFLSFAPVPTCEPAWVIGKNNNSAHNIDIYIYSNQHDPDLFYFTISVLIHFVVTFESRAMILGPSHANAIAFACEGQSARLSATHVSW